MNIKQFLEKYDQVFEKKDLDFKNVKQFWSIKKNDYVFEIDIKNNEKHDFYLDFKKTSFKRFFYYFKNEVLKNV